MPPAPSQDPAPVQRQLNRFKDQVDEEGVGETSGQAAGSLFRRVFSAKADPAGIQFPFAEALPRFHHRFRLCENLDPDVFADALECSGLGAVEPALVEIFQSSDHRRMQAGYSAAREIRFNICVPARQPMPMRIGK
ncbi:hypothetical protein [Afipia sp. P52-10]|uniref:hypothetical protein n=1 Tax=Afipia sp. P52-10 TaxID=1429916 RepID=UPI001268610F|nr:hypothetical protein [Afipia sp. P52-10]